MRWQPLRFSDGAGGITVVQKYLDAAMGQRDPVRADLARPVPAARPDPATLLQLDEEVTDTLLQSATLTDLSKVRAEYWADGPAQRDATGALAAVRRGRRQGPRATPSTRASS